MRWKLGMAGLLLSLVVVMAARPVAAAEPPSEKSFLLRYYYLDVTDSGTTEKEILVFRDGLSVERFRIDSSYKVFLRYQSTPENFERLLAALAHYKIGQEKGNCRSVAARGPDESFTWFGRGQRQNTFVIGDRFTELCSNETVNLILEIGTFLWGGGFGSVESIELRD